MVDQQSDKSVVNLAYVCADAPSPWRLSCPQPVIPCLFSVLILAVQ